MCVCTQKLNLDKSQKLFCLFETYEYRFSHYLNKRHNNNFVRNEACSMLIYNNLWTGVFVRVAVCKLIYIFPHKCLFTWSFVSSFLFIGAFVLKLIQQTIHFLGVINEKLPSPTDLTIKCDVTSCLDNRFPSVVSLEERDERLGHSVKSFSDSLTILQLTLCK